MAAIDRSYTAYYWSANGRAFRHSL